MLNEDIGTECDFNETKHVDKITSIKSSYFNNKIHCSPTWINPNNKGEVTSNQRKLKMIENQSKTFEEWDLVQIKSDKNIESNKEILKDSNNRYTLDAFASSDRTCPVDEQIIEKYWNILSQKTYTGKESRERNWLLNINNEFPKEGNKTVLSIQKSENSLTSRCVSHKRQKKSETRANDWKSARRNNSK